MLEKLTVSTESIPLSRQMFEIQNQRMRSLESVRDQVRDLTVETIGKKADALFAQVLIFPCKQLTKATYKLVMVGLNPGQYQDPSARFERQKQKLLMEVERLCRKMESTIGDYV